MDTNQTGWPATRPAFVAESYFGGVGKLAERRMVPPFEQSSNSYLDKGVAIPKEMVPPGRIELPLRYRNGILNPARLPIPPQGLRGVT
jgi:hypothetical protein